MSRELALIVKDDTDGAPADEVHEVTHDGWTYVLDLSAANAAQMRADIEKWTSKAHEKRRAAGTSVKPIPKQLPRKESQDEKPKPTPKRNRAQMAAIREWGREHGYQIADRGRVPSHIVLAHDRARQAAVDEHPSTRARRRRLEAVGDDGGTR